MLYIIYKQGEIVNNVFLIQCSSVCVVPFVLQYTDKSMRRYVYIYIQRSIKYIHVYVTMYIHVTFHSVHIESEQQLFCSVGVSQEDFMKLMQHSEIPGPERFAVCSNSW